MNLQPWVGPGVMPMAPYGPIPQMAFKAIEWERAREYGHKEWQRRAADDFRRSLTVAIPGWYGITDIMKTIEEMRMQTPYIDEKGFYHYDSNIWKALTDYAGVTTFYNEREAVLEALKTGENMRMVRDFEDRYRMVKVPRNMYGIKAR